MDLLPGVERITQAKMDEAVGLLRDATKKLHEQRVKFHDKTESHGWSIWVTRHPGQHPKVSLTGSLSGFPIDQDLIKDGYTQKHIPTEDPALAAILLDLVRNTTESLERVLERERKEKESA